MSGAEQSNDAGFVSDLKTHAPLLMAKLEEGDYSAASEVIQQLNESREKSIYQEVGKLTRGLHDAIVNFHVDNGMEQFDEGGTESQIKDAADRLDYVVVATQNAANKTMDLVEDGIPIASNFSDEAELLKKEWKRLAQRELDVGEFRELYKRIEGFLELSVDSASRLKDDFNNILLAQDYQDLTGQVIQKVIQLIHEVEDSLVDLVRIASDVEQVAGVTHDASDGQAEDSNADATADLAAEGPVMHAEERDDVCKGQDEVDDLLSSLGF